MSNNGFIYVASREEKYYNSAVYGANTLRDYYPDANITLYCNDYLLDKKAEKVFDNVITENVPDNERAKMWAMARTPYEKTMYLDADTEIWHSEIQTVFDHLDDEHDLCLTKVRDYSAIITYFPGGKFTWHCGVALYNNKPDTLKFMQDWYDFYQLQQKMRKGELEWDLDKKLYPPKDLAYWDTFTFWRLLHLEGYSEKIKIKCFPEDARWNFHFYRPSEVPNDDTIIYHHSLGSSTKLKYGS